MQTKKILSSSLFISQFLKTNTYIKKILVKYIIIILFKIINKNMLTKKEDVNQTTNYPIFYLLLSYSIDRINILSVCNT